MTGRVNFRLGRRDEAHAFCALSNALYSRKVTQEYYHWQFFDCPHTPLIMTGWNSDRMVAAFGVHVVAKTHFPRAMSLDIMISADYQGQGLIAALLDSAMQEASQRGARLLSVVGNARARTAVTRWAGWTTWRTLSDWVAPTRPQSNELRAELGEPNLDELPASSASRTFYPRDSRTLAWRTLSSPRYDYVWLKVFRRPDEGLGWAVCKLFRDPGTNEGFGDVVSLFPTSDVIPVLEGAIGWLHDQGITKAAIYPASDTERSAAATLGFTPSKRERYFCGLGEDPGLELGMLDIDVY